MDAPSPAKIWQFNVNQELPTLGNQTTEMRTLWFAVKTALTGFTSNPWIVVRSSNSVTAGAADYWSSVANLVMSAGAHSWIVLKQLGMGTSGNFQLLIDLNSSVAYQAALYLSVSVGFTGGTTSTRPTASDELTVVNGNWFSIEEPGDVALHLLQSGTGDSLRMLVCAKGVLRTYFFIETLTESWLANPVLYAFSASSISAPSHVSTTYWYGSTGTSYFSAYVGVTYFHNSVAPNALYGTGNYGTGAYALSGMTLHSETTGYITHIGRIPDMYMGSSAVVSGSTYPLSQDTKAWVQLLQFVLPWNGTNPVLT